MNFTAGSDEQLSAKVRTYRAAIAGARGPAGTVNNRFCCTPTALVLEDDREACEYGFRGARFFQESLATYLYSGERVVGRLDVSRDTLPDAQLAKIMAARNAPGSALNSVIGDPKCAIEAVGRFQSAGVDELILVTQMATIPHELILRSLRTFAEKVMPHFDSG